MEFIYLFIWMHGESNQIVYSQSCIFKSNKVPNTGLSGCISVRGCVKLKNPN